MHHHQPNVEFGLRYKDYQFTASPRIMGHITVNVNKKPAEFRKAMIKRLTKYIKNVNNQYSAIFRTRCIDQPTNRYYMIGIDKLHVKNDFFSYTKFDDPMDIFSDALKRNLHTYPCRIMVNRKTTNVAVIWCHSCFDGVAGHRIIKMMLGEKPPEYKHIPQPTVLQLIGSYWNYIPTSLDIFIPSQLHDDFKTTQASRLYKLPLNSVTVRTQSKLNNVSFISQALSNYVTKLFDSLPLSVTYLKTAIPVNIASCDANNKFSCIYCVIFRGKTSSKTLHKQLYTGLNFVYQVNIFYNTIDIINTLVPNIQQRICDLYDLGTNIKAFKTDLVFSCMRQDISNKHIITVYNPCPAIPIYACYSDNIVMTSYNSPVAFQGFE